MRIAPVAHGKTDVGRQRGHNEDAFVCEPDLDLFVVCDGMGGNNAGEVASALATTSLRNFYRATLNGVVPGEELRGDQGLTEAARRLIMGVRKANADVFEISSTRLEHKGMGSTIVAMSVSRETSSVQVAHVGDSRCYRIRDAKIEPLTRDHSLIGDALAWNPNLSEEELSMLPKNIISRALGLKQAVEVDVRSDLALPGDIYLLCSDGLCGVVKDKQILEIILLSNDLPDACESLIALANDAGGPDNITAVAIRLEADGALASSGPEILISVVGEDDVPLEGDAAAEVTNAARRSGTRCEKCGRRANGSEVYCGQCGARIAL
ncbi:MAG TPA: protein phosphatase 2C domain-containing protein [Polyangiaceae bacterium]|nr:protein phosphatase 2C domain-containing protein [Polyangiaceae bacterium]